MGQKLGKATYDPKVRVFVNVSPGCIETLWQTFNDVADGFGINLPEMKLICAHLSEELDLARDVVERHVSILFKVLDSDGNDLVDAIEFLAAIAGSSGLSERAKLEFLLNCFDFDGTGHLSVDEMTLAFRCSLMGLCKLAGESCPLEEELEAVAMRAFVKDKIKIADAVSFCQADPETVSWLRYFDDPDPMSSISGKADDDEEGGSFLESIDYLPKQQEVDYAKDGLVALGRSISEAAALQGAPVVAAARARQRNRTQQQEDDDRNVLISSLTPTALANVDIDLSPPQSSLSLEWVHGYRGEDCRGNVWYTGAGEIVYPAAQLAIVYNPLQHTQRHMTVHSGRVTCLALSAEGSIAATGEAGESPCIVCWDVATCNSVCILSGCHTLDVSQLAFSPRSGEYLASVDAALTMVVWNWKLRQRVYSSLCCGTGGKIFGIAFLNPDDHFSLVACGDTDPYVVFWERGEAGSIAVRRRGAFGRRARRQPTLCAARCVDVCLTGQASGHLYVWHGRNCVKSIKAHRGSLNAIDVNTSSVVTGGKDGKIRQWSLHLEPGATFDICDLGACSTIRAVRISRDGAKLLVGTGGNEVFELSSADGSDALGGPVTSSHHGASLLGLATHPHKPEFATCGADRTLRVWDILTRNPIRTLTLDTAATCCAFHPNGELLAVGLGHSTQEILNEGVESKSGAFVVLDDGLKMIMEARDSKLPLTICRFSPDGKVLAFGSRDTSVYLYACLEGYEMIGICRRHSSPLLTIDFSVDSRWLRSGCEAGQLHFFNTSSGQHQSNTSALKDLRWATESCLFAYGSAGAQSQTICDDAILTACGRARAVYDESDGPETGGGVICTADSYGRVRLQNFPSRPNSAYLEWRGHAGSVAQVAFNSDDTHLLSVGSDDRCILQWTLSEDEREPEDADVVSDSYDVDVRPEITRDCSEFLPSSRLRDVAINCFGEASLVAEQKQQLADNDKIDKSTESANAPFETDPWHLNQIPPTNPPQPKQTPPKSNLTLSRVFGFGCGHVRNNAHYCDDGILYTAGGVLVHINIDSGHQSFGTAHAGREILALALSCDRLMCATSDASSEPSVALYSTNDISNGPFRIIREPHQYAITLLAFNNQCSRIVSVGADENHTLAIHDILSGHQLFSSMTTKLKPLHVTFGHDGAELAIVGVKYVLFFAFGSGHAATKHAMCTFARIRRLGKLQTFFSVAYLPDGTTVVGTSDGHLYLFDVENRELEKSTKAHDSAVLVLDAPWCLPGKQLTALPLVSGSKDGTVKIWSKQLECILSFDNRGAGPIRAISTSCDGSRVLVGSQAAAQLREFRASDGTPVSAGSVVGGGAASGELWGLAAHPKEQEVVVASDDGALVFWSLEKPAKDARLRAMQLQGPCRSLAFSPDGKYIAAALGGPSRADAKATFWTRTRRDLTIEKDTKDPTAVPNVEGTLQVRRSDTGALINRFTEAREWLRDVKFSADGSLLAAGGNDGQTHVYKMDAHGHFIHALSHTFGGSAPICSIDVSKDNQYVQVADEARSVAYADLSAGLAVSDPALLRDTEWATWSSPLGWPTIAAHSVYVSSGAGGYELSEEKGEDENKRESPSLNLISVARSHSEDIMATGDQHGILRLLRYPAGDSSASASRLAVAHVGPIRRIEWSANDQFLVTLGQHDGTICVWRYEAEKIDNESIPVETERDDAVDADGGHALISAVDRSSRMKQECLAECHDSGQETDSASHKYMLDVPMWTSKLIPPSNLVKEDPSPPHVCVKLQTVHGQRSDDCRGMVAYNSDGAIVYSCGALGVIYDPRTHKQAFHFHHSQFGGTKLNDAERIDVSSVADVSSIAITPDGRFAATGDQSAAPRVRIWDALTGTTIYVLPRHLRIGVISLAFSHDGTRLAAIGGDNDQSFCLYATNTREWADAMLVGRGAIGRERVFCCTFAGKTAYPLFVGTRNGVEFFRPAPCGGVTRRQGDFTPPRCPLVNVLCAVRAFVTTTTESDGHTSPISDSDSDAAVLTGTSSGSLYLWQNLRVSDQVTGAHKGPVYAVATAQLRGLYASGGRDGTVKLWDAQLKPVQTFHLEESSFVFLTPAVASLRFGGARETKLLSVARSGELFELATASGEMSLLDQAHARTQAKASEARGLDTHPNDGDVYATCGDDSTVRIWSISRRRCIQRAPPELFGGAAARSCSWSPDGLKLAVGLGGDPSNKARDGTIVLLQVDLSSEDKVPEVVAEARKSKSPIADIKWSGNGKLVLAASEDGRVYVHDGEDARLKTMCTKAGAPLTSIDISSDEAYVQAGTSTDDLHFFKVADGSRVSIPAEVRDVDWASVSVPYGWCVQGCWKGTGELKEETAVQAAEKSPRFLRTEWRPRILTLPGLSTVDRSPNRAFLAKGCFDGTVAIYNYPAQAPGMSMVCAPCGHGSRIGKVRFTCDGKHLIALGQFNRVVTVYSLFLEENAD